MNTTPPRSFGTSDHSLTWSAAPAGRNGLSTWLRSSTVGIRISCADSPSERHSSSENGVSDAVNGRSISTGAAAARVAVPPPPRSLVPAALPPGAVAVITGAPPRQRWLSATSP